MSNEEKTLEQVLWDSANVMRQTMGAADYMDYALGIIFYKHLSDKVLESAAMTLVDAGEVEESDVETEAQRQAVYQKYYSDESFRDDLLDSMDMDYTIKPEATFTALMDEIRAQKFQLEHLNQAFTDIEQSNSDLLGHLFDDVDLHSTKLGSTPQKRNELIADVMTALAPLNLDSHSGDILGDAYEYMISNFASDMGQKAGEFYTPQSVSTLLTHIVTSGNEEKKGFSAYDPAMGSGSLLLNVKHYIEDADSIEYYGQEIKTSTYNLARMNMIIHGVAATNQHLHNADTLDKDWPADEVTDFDAVMMNDSAILAEVERRQRLLERSALLGLRCAGSKVEGRLCLSAAWPLPSEVNGHDGHRPAAWRAVPRRHGGQDSPETPGKGLYLCRHRPAGRYLLFHGYPDHHHGIEERPPRPGYPVHRRQ